MPVGPKESEKTIKTHNSLPKLGAWSASEIAKRIARFLGAHFIRETAMGILKDVFEMCR